MRIVLASASPRRKALLEALGIVFEVVTSNVGEALAGDPASVVIANARAKRDDVASRLSGDSPSLIIAADTLVTLDGQVLGKPADASEARSMLERLSGRTHEVLTGIAVVDTASRKHVEGMESTRVTFQTLAPDEVDRFVEAVNPLDRAGAYTVDGPGSLLVARYEGCYYNVLGLPIVRLDKLLRKAGFSLFELMDASRSSFL